MKRKPLELLLYRYPQLGLPPKKEMAMGKEYIDIVRKGNLPETLVNPFQMSKEDQYDLMENPAGPVEVFFLKCRNDFERTVKILAYRGEKEEIPSTMGAVTIWGINDWRKINAHKNQYFEQGGKNWTKEFSEFTKVKQNYQDVLILVSEGDYSALPAEKTKFADCEWKQFSRIIRTYHELTHIVSRKLFPEHKNVLRDEILADCIGLTKALGEYDRKLALDFLGIKEDGKYIGGRLENYLPKDAEPAKLAVLVRDRIVELEQALSHAPKEPFERLIYLEENNIIYKR